MSNKDQFQKFQDQPAAPSTQLRYGQQQNQNDPYNQNQGQVQVQVRIGQPQNFLAGAAHPGTCIFHMAFKIAVVVVYLLLSFAFNDIFTFTLVIILASIDFWITQNISGRILVGLRWRNKIKEDGSEEWIFESLPDRSNLNKVDEYIFWGSLFIYSCVWILFLILNIISLDVFWTVVDLVLFVLAFTNALNYIRCKKGNFQILDWEQKIKQIGTQKLISGAITMTTQKK